MVGSHLFNATPFTLSQDMIEEGYFPVHSAPHEGLRFVYVPRDDNDLTFTPLDKKITVSNGTAPEGITFSGQEFFGSGTNNPDAIEYVNTFTVKQLKYVGGLGRNEWQTADVHNQSMSRHYG